MSILSLSLLFSYPVLCTRSGCCRHFHTARSEEGSIWFSPTVNIIKYITVPASIMCDTAAPSVHRVTGFSERIKLSLNSFPLSTTPGPHRYSCCHWSSLSLVKDYTERYVGVHYSYSLPFSQPDPVSHSSLRTFSSFTCPWHHAIFSLPSPRNAELNACGRSPPEMRAEEPSRGG